MEYLEKKPVHRNSIFDSIKKEITFELDSSNLIIDISHNVINILGFLSDEMIGRNIFDFIEVKESYFNLNFLDNMDMFFIHKNGNCVWIEDYVTPVYDNNEKLIAFEGVCRDISYRKALEENLSYLTYHDSLTGLKNRAFYDKQIEELNTLSNLPVGIIVCDLDNLKVINDTMGHNKGDSIIKSVSDLLLGIENNHISISRIGGDEFVILVKNTSEFEIEELGRNINLLIKKHNSKNRECPIQLSIGYAFADRSVGKMEEIFKMADKNMYANKLHKNKRDRNVLEVTYNYTTIVIE